MTKEGIAAASNIRFQIADLQLQVQDLLIDEQNAFSRIKNKNSQRATALKLAVDILESVANNLDECWYDIDELLDA